MGSRTVANIEPLFPGTPFLRSYPIRFLGRVTNRTGGGDPPFLLFRAGEDGCVIESIEAIPLQTYGSDSVLRLFAGQADGIGLLSELVCPAATVDNETPAPRNPFLLNTLVSPPAPGAGGYRVRAGEGIWVGTGTPILGDGYQIVVMGGDL